MAEERITETRSPDGNTHTTTTIVTDRQNSGDSTKWISLLVLVLLAGAALFMFSQMSDSESAKDAAVGEGSKGILKQVGKKVQEELR